MNRKTRKIFVWVMIAFMTLVTVAGPIYSMLAPQQETTQDYGDGAWGE